MKLLSFGEVLWDIYPNDKFIGGAPFNFAAHCALLGADSYMVSAVGSDELGKDTIEKVKAFGVKTDFIGILSDKETGKCLVTLDCNAHPTYNLLTDVAYDYIQFPKLTENFDVIGFGTLALRNKNNKKVLADILDTYSFGEVFSDLNIRAPFYSKESVDFCLSNATIVKISDEELPTVAELALGQYSDVEKTIIQLAERFTQIKLIIVTKGACGSCCYDCKDKKFYYADAVPTKVISTVGAGDSFSAAFLVKYFDGEDISDCLRFASKISAHVCANSDAIPID